MKTLLLIFLEMAMVLYLPTRTRLTRLGKQTLKVYCQELSNSDCYQDGIFLFEYEPEESCSNIFISFIPNSAESGNRISSGHNKVYFKGPSNMFFKVASSSSTNGRETVLSSSPFSYIDDYPVLTIPIFPNNKINQYLLSWNMQYMSVDRLISLFDEHNLISCDTIWVNNHVFNTMETVDIPPQFPNGIEGYRKIIHESYLSDAEFKGETLSEGLVLTAIVVVDERGDASFKEIRRSSGFIEIDNWATETCKLICRNKFSPATHRGRKVRCEYPIYFFKKDLSRDDN